MKAAFALIGLINWWGCLGCASGRSAADSSGETPFAGVWKGKLRAESQDSYRGNNAKGAHRVSSGIWIFEISPDEKKVSAHLAEWKGPRELWNIKHKDGHTITWHETGKASAALLPTVFYDKQGRVIGKGVGVRADFDADWTMRLVSDKTATVSCSANREDIYARITDTTATGTLRKTK